jgi:hypothetical protein
MAAASQQVQGQPGNVINIEFHQNNTFNGDSKVDTQTINQIVEAGRRGADDLKARLEEIERNKERVSFR